MNLYIVVLQSVEGGMCANVAIIVETIDFIMVFARLVLHCLSASKISGPNKKKAQVVKKENRIIQLRGYNRHSNLDGMLHYISIFH